VKSRLPVEFAAGRIVAIHFGRFKEGGWVLHSRDLGWASPAHLRASQGVSGGVADWQR